MNDVPLAKLIAVLIILPALVFWLGGYTALRHRPWFRHVPVIGYAIAVLVAAAVVALRIL